MKAIAYNQPIKYRDFLICTSYNHDLPLTFSHEDYDGAPDANDHRAGECKTIEECIEEINEMYEDPYYGLEEIKPTPIIIYYFGTELDRPGHYFWDVEMNTLRKSKIGFNNLEFNPERLIDYPLEKGQVTIHETKRWKILRIEGSCYDRRGGTKSVFFTKGKVTDHELIAALQSTPITKRIIEQMPFEVKWPAQRSNFPEKRNPAPPVPQENKIPHYPKFTITQEQGFVNLKTIVINGETPHFITESWQQSFEPDIGTLHRFIEECNRIKQ